MQHCSLVVELTSLLMVQTRRSRMDIIDLTDDMNDSDIAHDSNLLNKDYDESSMRSEKMEAMEGSPHYQEDVYDDDECEFNNDYPSEDELDTRASIGHYQSMSFTVCYNDEIRIRICLFIVDAAFVLL